MSRPAALGDDGPAGEVADGNASVLLVGSSGGHLSQLLALEPWYRGRKCHWVTFDTPDALGKLRDESVTWARWPTTRSLPKLLQNLRLAWRDVRRHRPDIIVSTGAAVAVPYFLVGKLHGARTAYIEVYDRVDSRTVTGRLCRPVTDVFCVQWEEQKSLYPGAHVIGPLL